MQKIVFTNSRGQSIEFGRDDPYILSAIDGLGDVAARNTTQKSSNQDGTTLVDSSLEERFITLKISMFATTLTQLSIERQKISSVFNPKLGEGLFQYIYGDEIKIINAASEHVPIFPSGKDNRLGNYQLVAITLCCPNPYFRNVADKKTEIAYWEPLFSFPLEIESDGIEMGVRSPSLIVNVLNDGHVDTGMIIQFKALGTVVKPSLVNVNTGEYFKINRTLTAGEVITVNTNRGKKRIESDINGVKTNIFNKIVLGSKFLQLDIGDNLFRYDAEEYLEALEVNIYHSPQFVGV
jgi:Phage tail protein